MHKICSPQTWWQGLLSCKCTSFLTEEANWYPRVNLSSQFSRTAHKSWNILVTSLVRCWSKRSPEQSKLPPRCAQRMQPLNSMTITPFSFIHFSFYCKNHTCITEPTRPVDFSEPLKRAKTFGVICGKLHRCWVLFSRYLFSLQFTTSTTMSNSSVLAHPITKQ